jgi:urease accessory protein
LDLASLDDGVDAAIMCTVGRRASVAQGRALLSIWERAFASSFRRDGEEESRIHGLLKDFSALLRQQSSSDIPPASAHVAPLFGVIARLTGVGERETAYIYMLSHAKALLSAAVRASVLGPYQAQKVLASIEIQEDIETVIEREWHANHEDAGQMVPIMDLWIGRHELLYSRIFNS